MNNMPNTYEHLCSIGNVNFTKREIDVVSFVLHGRVAKKIASILGISHKTVGTHLGNIMTKIGCRSQEGIIDFIEKSNKYEFVRTHYTNLLVKFGFRQELSNIKELLEALLHFCSI